jgi:hypothetical protein
VRELEIDAVDDYKIANAKGAQHR